MFRLMPKGLLALGVFTLLGACGGGGDSTPPPPAPTPSATLSLSAASGSVTAGASTTVTANIARAGGFAGPVTIASTGAPAGVTVTGGTIDASASSLVVTIATTAGAATGAATINITATSTSVTIAPATFALTVNPPPGVTLSLSSATATVAAGASTTATATITRTGGFTGDVVIAASGAPSGVTITGGTIASGATTQTITIAAAANATQGTANVSVTGTATGLTIAPSALALTVSPPPVGQVGNFIGGEAGGDQAAKVALSADGSRVVIGAPFNDGTATSAGHARVFQRNGSTWTQLGQDLDGEAADDRFGGAVAINDAGTRIAVGSYLNDGAAPAAGHVRVYELNGNAWVQLGADIDGPGNSAGAGFAVDMSASGSRVIVGGPGVNTISGVVSVYEYNGSAWTLVGSRLTGSLEQGAAVAISDNGNRIAFSQPSGATNLPGSVFVHDWNGTTWTQVGAPIVGEAADDGAGGAISLSGDGTVIAIGADLNTGLGLAGGGSPGGHVRVYRFASGAWSQLGADLDGPPGSRFGTSVSLSADGTRLMAGGPPSSLAKLYILNGSTWSESPQPAFNADSRAGASVAISADGRVAAVGAEFGVTPAGNSAGIVRVYSLP